MTITVQCPKCGKRYGAPERMAGKRVTCKNCGSGIDVPAAAPSWNDSAETVADAPAIIGGAEPLDALQAVPGETFDSTDSPIATPGMEDVYSSGRGMDFPYSREVDKWLPWVLAVGSLIWLGIQNVHSAKTQAPLFLVASVFVLIFIQLLVFFPMGILALYLSRRATGFLLPPGFAWRVFGAFALPYALTYTMWSVAGDSNGLISGAVLGVIMVGMLIWVIFRPATRQLMPTLLICCGAFLVAVAIGGLLLAGANLVTLSIANEMGKAQLAQASPYGPGLRWAEPKSDDEEGKKPGHRRPTVVTKTPGDEQKTPTVPGPTVATPDTVQPPVIPPVVPVNPTETVTQNPTNPTVDHPDMTATTVIPDTTTRPTVATNDPTNPTVIPPQTTTTAPAANVLFEKPDAIVNYASVASTVGAFDELLYPSMPSPWIGVVKSQGEAQESIERWNTSPPAKAGGSTFRHEAGARDRYIISPNGDSVTRIVTWPRLAAQVWSFEQNKVVHNLDFDSKLGAPRLLGYVGQDQFAVLWSRENAQGIEVWDAVADKVLARMDLPGYQATPGNFAVSPEGRMCAIAAKLDNQAQLQIFDSFTGRITRRLAISTLDPRWPLTPSGICFSPDGTKVAVLFEQNNNGLILCWKLADGKLQAEHIFPSDILPDSSKLTDYDGRAFDWLSDNASWIIYGQAIVDANTGRPLADVGVEHVKGQHVLSDGTIHLIQQSPENAKRRLVEAKINPDKLKAAHP